MGGGGLASSCSGITQKTSTSAVKERKRYAWKIPSLWSQGTVEGGGSLRVTQPGPLLDKSSQGGGGGGGMFH